MYKLVIALALLGVTAQVHAGLWEKVTTMGNKTTKPTAQYNVEASGWNIRIYEWQPEDNPNVRCVFAGGSSKGGVSCYPVEKSKEK